MPKPRLESNQSLPNRWRYRFGAYHYRVPAGDEHKWGGKQDFRLGATLDEALETFERISSQGLEDVKVPDLLEVDDIFVDSIEVGTKSGIYFLLDGTEIVYVGQATNMFSRALEHSDKEWNAVTFLPANPEVLRLLEARYIRKFRPKYNIRHNG